MKKNKPFFQTGQTSERKNGIKISRQIICLSGQMAAGKNAASEIFENCGFVSVDFDTLVHQAIEEQTPAILAEFSQAAEQQGIELLQADGKLNRRALGSLIFKDALLLARQEAIVYPCVISLAKQFSMQNLQKNIIFNATVLFKIPELMQMCTAVVFIESPYLLRLLRAKKRDNIPFKQIARRFKTQKKLLQTYKNTGLPVFTVKNSSTLEALAKKIKKLIFSQILV